MTKNKVSFQKMVAAIAISSPKSTVLHNPINLKDQSSKFFGGSLKGFFLHVKPKQRRRDLTNLVVVSSVTPSTTTSNANGRFYFNFTGFPFPLGPFLNRSTIRTEVYHLPFLSSIFGFVAYFLLVIDLVIVIFFYKYYCDFY